MMEVDFTIPGRIGGKGRPRAFIDNRLGQLKVGHYTPRKTAKTEDLIRFYARAAMMGRDLFAGPLYLQIKLWLHRPKSWTKRRKATTRWVTGKPDADNIIKIVGDALNQIAFYDDSQISEISFVRQYVPDETPEQVRIHISAFYEATA